MSDIRIGISGWRYVPWRKDFYPEGLAQKNELKFASRAVNSIEINGSFYSLQSPDLYARWYADTPEGFVFSLKTPRYITHVKRLKDIDEALANFFASGIFQLKEKMGPILWQFPPSFKFDPEGFEAFLHALPHDGKAAKACAKHCAERMEKAGYLDIPAKARVRHAVEIRHESFAAPEFIRLLRRYKVALVTADTAGKWPYLEDLTSDFVYLRLHGDKQLYASGYTASALKRWGDRIDSWRRGEQPEDAHLACDKLGRSRKSRDVYCYFDNDIKVRAPYDARQLLERFGLAAGLEVAPGDLKGAQL
ncbi:MULTISPECIES: DUF72 domain-containing protein [unclassified Pseudomonas]|uniref:DUF72 domain-containing protein n=1 Tax=unclassified Pseudomonas TaxID=196821 RepID=UPI000D35FA17|nr:MULTISPECIES: DUF72 domain-containing protein [unclassified Pseudomonas]RAU47354.1 DUF72 domain-containing protein [Pseudomonas sp. RIT 409]RAU51971.1 DUF72 domain-containing protein [Pseudomonas sp. RIT 412]